MGLVLVVVVVGAGWLILSRSSGTTPAAATPSTTTASGDYHDNIYLSKTNPDGAAYMTDFAGMALYTFDNDQSGVSTCTGSCAKAWPPYTSGATAQGQFPAGITVITRADGSTQFAWNGKPLYYYSKDVNAGDANGDGVGGIWHIVKL